jgi:hypothetical protein
MRGARIIDASKHSRCTGLCEFECDQAHSGLGHSEDFNLDVRLIAGGGFRDDPAGHDVESLEALKGTGQGAPVTLSDCPQI